MLSSKYLKRNLINILGWRTNRKIIVFESDDWGSIRMASKKAFQFFIKLGYKVDQCYYNSFDTLESNLDLEGLYEVLNSHRDSNNNPVVFTINNIVANPDFQKIKNSNFKKYYYEVFTETLRRYPYHDRVYDLYKDGIINKLIQPQFHGREHLNVNRWMEALNKDQKELMVAFNHEMFTIHTKGIPNGRDEYLDAFGLGYKNEIVPYTEIINSGLDIFTSLWNRNSKSFIAPNYVWPKSIEKTLMDRGIYYIQGTHVQKIPLHDDSLKIKKKYHYLGQKNNLKQIYSVRNAFFEPSSDKNINWIDQTLGEIEVAFKWEKPAIISSHRVNYIGGINPSNRDKGLKLLDELLSRIKRKYPNVEFLSSDQLGDLIN